MNLFLRTIPLGALLCVSSLAATAATLCVNSGGSYPCYTRITDAVAAANAWDVIEVGAGVYHESITITKPLSLVTDKATIDASGLSRGIFVNGLARPGLSGVNISGFTIKNANFEGVLILNASNVTLSSNSVLHNNRSLSGESCPGIESFEPGSQLDCGEGIHLQAADHSIVTHNTVEENSGGILISDDTGAVHDNLISYNVVQNNPYDCGITMASHPQAPQSVSTVPLGVYHNTVLGNQSNANGTAGAGAGIGIFASIPGAKAYGNVVVDNYASGNGIPGIAMHAHAPNQMLSDNMLVGNTLVKNGQDGGDAATPGPTGINLYSLGPAPGNIIAENTIRDENYDVTVKVPSLVQVQFNELLGRGTGVANLGAGTVYATENWWGCPAGPDGKAAACSGVLGTNVIYAPWLTNPIPDGRMD